MRSPGKLSIILCTVLTCALALFAAPRASRAAQPLSDADQKFLTLYEQVLKGLVTGNLPAAKEAANAIPQGAGADVANAKDLKAARDAFGTLSQQAEKLAAGQPGYHVFYCPMVKKDWVQMTPEIANPYLGQDMLTCGVEKK